MSEVQSDDAPAAPSELVAAGRRHLAVRDYYAAASTLAEACEALAKEHGEAADQCAEAYLWYGKALLGLSREESGVLGDGVPGADNAEEEDDNDEQEENGEAEAVEENGKSEANTNGEAESSTAPSTTKEEADTSTAEAGPADTNGVSNEPGTSNGEAAGEGNEELADLDEDEVDNLQLAWEMLELARSILQRRAGGPGAQGGPGGQEGPPGREALAALAEVHLALGEVALESETYDKAVVEMTRCLELQQQLGGGPGAPAPAPGAPAAAPAPAPAAASAPAPAADRRVAETHYQLGLANSLASNFEDAITHFRNAANILESRIKTLEAAGGGCEAEIKELRALLPEIQEKISDTADCRSETIKRLREQLLPSNGGGGAAFPGAGAGSSGAGGAGGAGAARVSGGAGAADISHLIKRKRKPSEGSGEAEGSAAKRANT